MHLDGRLDAAVESDIVGYTTVAMESGKWYQVGNPFATLDGSDTFTLTEAFPGFAPGDRIFIATSNGGYIFYTWVVDPTTGEGGWSLFDDELYDEKNEYPQGEAVYIHKKTAGVVTLSGTVKKVTNSFGSEAGNTWDLVALPWPETKKLSDYTWTGCENGDRIFIATSNGGFIFYTWVVDSTTGESGWSLFDDEFYDDEKTLDPGVAVYINKASKGVGTVTIK